MRTIIGTAEEHIFHDRPPVSSRLMKESGLVRSLYRSVKDFARLTGHGDVRKLAVSDLCITHSEISGHTTIEHG